MYISVLVFKPYYHFRIAQGSDIVVDAIVSASEVASLNKIFFFNIFSFKFAYWGQVAKLGSGQVHDLTLCNHEKFFEPFKEVAEDFKIKK